MLAHAVDFGNRRARCEQRPGQRLLLGERQARRRRDPIRRRAAGHQHGDQIVRSGGIGERQGFEGRGQSGRIGDRVPGFDHPHVPGRTGIAVTGDREAADPARGQAAVVEVVPFRDLGHRARALAGGQDEQPAGPRRLRQVRRQAMGWMRGRHRGVEQAFQEGAAWPGHDQMSLPLRRSALSTAGTTLSPVLKRWRTSPAAARRRWHSRCNGCTMTSFMEPS